MPGASQPLTDLAAGSKAVVAALKVAPEHKPRLMEMGILVGTVVELVRFAPMGDPVEIKVRGYHLSLRRSDAALVFVKPS